MKKKHLAAFLLLFIMVIVLMPLSTVASAESTNTQGTNFIMPDSDTDIPAHRESACMHYQTENDVVISKGTCVQPETIEGTCTLCGETVQKTGYYGDHNYVAGNVHDYYLTMTCEYCNDTEIGEIPSYLTLYSVLESDYYLSYKDLSTEVYTNSSEYVYAEIDYYADYTELDFIISDPDLLTIEEAFDVHYDFYSFSFKDAGKVTVTVVSKYDHNTQYGTYTFNITEKPKSGDINGDGALTSADARLILRLAANISSCSNVTRQFADTDGNGKVSSSDARLALRVAAKIDDFSVLAEFEPEQNNPWYYDDIQALTLNEGESKTMEYFIVRQNSPITWKSSNPAAVKVDSNGKITAVKKGFSCIIVSNGDETFYYEINVKNALQKKIDTLRDKYPEGYYWNNHAPSKKYPNVTETPCNDHASKKYAYCKGQCAGFAALLFNEVHGSKAKKSYGVTWNNVKIGDYIRLQKHHSVFVIDVIKKGDIVGYDYYYNENIVADEPYMIVAHCNWGMTCNIEWDAIFRPSYAFDSSQSYTVK